MVTTEEIEGLPLFAMLGPAERERLSRAAADISLLEGEYGVHEGDERALYAVLEGRLEVIRVVDRIERVIGERLPAGHLRGGADHRLATTLWRFVPGDGEVAGHAGQRPRTTRRIAAVVPEIGLEVAALAAETKLFSADEVDRPRPPRCCPGPLGSGLQPRYATSPVGTRPP